MPDYRDLVVGVAGAAAIGVSQVALAVLADNVGVGAQLSILAAVGFTSYFGSYAIFDSLYSNWFWPKFADSNLSGQWAMHLTNLADGSTRRGEVMISHTPKTIKISCINYRDGGCTPYSTWTSRIAEFTDRNTLVFLYEVESTVDWKPFKRGAMRLLFSGERPDILTGDFFDNAPSDDRGPVVFQRLSN